jgi:ketopantoate reductase
MLLQQQSQQRLLQLAARVLRGESVALLSSSSPFSSASFVGTTTASDDNRTDPNRAMVPSASLLAASSLAPSPPSPPPPPLHVLGAGALGMMVSASLRLAYPRYPVKLLVRERRAPKSSSRSIPSDNEEEDEGDISRLSRREGRDTSSNSSSSNSSSMTISYQRVATTASASSSALSSSSSRRTKLTPPRLVEVPVEEILQEEEDDSDGSTASAASDASAPQRRRPLRMIRNVLVTTKAYDVRAALRSIRDRVDSTTRVVLLCNGALAVQNELAASNDWYSTTTEEEEPQSDDAVQGALFSSYAAPTIHLAWTTHGAYRPTAPAPTTARAATIDEGSSSRSEFRGVVHAGTTGHTRVEEWPELAHYLSQAGLNCASSSSKEIRTQLWRKLAANCCINPLTALRQCRNGELLGLMMMTTTRDDDDDDSSRANEDAAMSVAEQIAAVVDEVVQVAAAEDDDDDGGIQLCRDDTLQFVKQVLADTASNYSSMVQDVQHQRRTEVMQLNGYVVERGRAHSIACPVNERLWKQIEELDRTIVVR